MESAVYALNSEEFKKLIATSKNKSHALQRLGLIPAGSNPITLTRRIKEEGIDCTHFEQNNRIARAKLLKRHAFQLIPLKYVLVINSNCHSSHLRDRLIKEGVLQNRCANCKLGAMWDNKPLTLILDHINGVHTDNRKENLRLLCPNCNSQTNTFGSKNDKFKARYRNACPICGKDKLKSRTTCSLQCNGIRSGKISDPSTKVIIRGKQNGISNIRIGKEIGISERAVRKRIKTLIKFGVLIPGSANGRLQVFDTCHVRSNRTPGTN